ncbi:TetR family transcriptional regulator [Aliiruegeria haliotis]|uniref:TetR family transcriptional regulator n=2 Tax=Aliiruegeria haliotis TaxID=1280846 RepID=A0A2T0RED6_9RHOB|nr:TetR family transcriptional regulator [Aliiruegeria haliotis]
MPHGARTERRILDAAYTLFVTAPADEFTMRNLARVLDIRMGNLTYHYKTKSDLVEALVRDRMATYSGDILDLLQITGTSPQDALNKTIAYLVRDLHNPEIAFFPQLWARALHDPVAEGMMDEIHEIERQFIAGLVRATRPDWGRHRCDALAWHITASIEWLTIFIGQNRRSGGIDVAPEEEIVSNLYKTV